MKIRKENERFYLIDENQNQTELKVIENHGSEYLRLPQKIDGKLHVSISRFRDTDEIDLENLPKKAPKSEESKPKSKPKTWEDYLTEEEKESIAEIKRLAEKRMQRELIEAEIESMKAKIAELEGKLEA